MRKAGCLVIAVNLALSGAGLRAEPPATTERIPKALIESANGWTYVNGQWVHPDGYKFVNNKVLRTTAKSGKASPKPPGKLALENPAKLTPRSKSTDDTRTAAEKAAEQRRKNLTPTAAPQTGTHL
ncbi:MAG: hypothetical protein DLM73_03070 [Chthoniobacterales bacterium]|nr:MAG: hypothetical protein DLM73_03070 [Chthoniobacterales bacterium]